MKTLYLIRHAHARSPRNAQNDFSRDLSPRGEDEAQACGKVLAGGSPLPSLIVCSPAIRTLRTARILAGILMLPDAAVITESTLYLASPHDLMETISSLPDPVPCVALVGHNPGISELARELSNQNQQDLPTAGILGVSFKTDSWSAIP